MGICPDENSIQAGGIKGRSKQMQREGFPGEQIEGGTGVYSNVVHTECASCRLEREERQRSIWFRLLCMFGCESELNHRVCLHCEANLHQLEGFVVPIGE